MDLTKNAGLTMKHGGFTVMDFMDHWIGLRENLQKTLGFPVFR